MVGTAGESSASLHPGLRRRAAMAAAGAIVLFATLAVHYAGRTRAGWLDTTITSALVRVIPAPGVPATMLHLGDPLPVAVFAMLMSAVAAARSHWRLALVALVGPGLTAISGALLKPLIARDFLGFLAFPSGHASAATALGLVAALVLASLLRLGPAGGTVLVAVGVIVSGGTMAVAVVTHRWHYPTDALGGICMAITLVLGSALLIEYLAERQPRR